MVTQQNQGQIQLLQLSSVAIRICEEIRYQPIPKGTARHWIPGSYKGTDLGTHSQKQFLLYGAVRNNGRSPNVAEISVISYKIYGN